MVQSSTWVKFIHESVAFLIVAWVRNYITSRPRLLDVFAKLFCSKQGVHHGRMMSCGNHVIQRINYCRGKLPARYITAKYTLVAIKVNVGMSADL